MFKNILARFRNKRTVDIMVSKDMLRDIYKLLQSVRLDLVESFYRIKDRKLREAYDPFAFMLLKYDKIIQFLRRILDEDLYTKHQKLSPQEVEEIILKLPLDVASTIRNLIQASKLLKEFSSSTSTPYIISIIKSINDIADDIAKYLDKIVN
ncbi:MAG: hypothetical protein QW775_02915 [Ignisphaera sp.]|uniref:DUF47 family protein n=2 Tax=Ignisphaera aggregans TaxID=334771 RepID=A0A832CRD1_9CREN